MGPKIKTETLPNEGSKSLNAFWAPSIEERYELRTNWMFDPKTWRCWIDIYGALVGSPTTSTRSWDLAPPAGGDIDYIGRCDVPFRRIYDVADLRTALKREREAFDCQPMARDPLVLMIRQQNSRSRLLTTRELFECALESCISTKRSCLEHVSSYGFRMEETDIGGPQLWYSPMFDNSFQHAARTPKLYECAYVLKYVERSRRPSPHSLWSERQTTVLQSTASNSWMLVTPSSSMQVALDEMMQNRASNADFDAFALHLSFIDAAIENWRPYLSHLTHETNDGVNRVVVTDPDDPDMNILTVDDRQRLRLIEDRIANMFAMLDSILDTVTSLREKYHIFHLSSPNIDDPVSIKIDRNAYRFREQVRGLQLLRTQLEALQARVSSCVTLLSSLLDLENGHSLRALAEEQRAEGVAMRALSRKAVQDAAAVKVITIITLIYLPVSVVANFFSTQFVSVVHDEAAGRNQLVIAENSWVLAAIALPLTGVTFGIWWWMYASKEQAGLRGLGSREEDKLGSSGRSTAIWMKMVVEAMSERKRRKGSESSGPEKGP